MAKEILGKTVCYDADCNLDLLKGKKNNSSRVRITRTCTFIKLKRERNGCNSWIKRRFEIMARS